MQAIRSSLTGTLISSHRLVVTQTVRRTAIPCIDQLHRLHATLAPSPLHRHCLQGCPLCQGSSGAFLHHTRQRSLWARLTGQKFVCTDLSYEDVKRRIADNSIVLIDCRNEDELRETGIIGQPINVPLPVMACSFSMPASAFQRQFGAVKPGKDADNIVIYCRSGVRALQAAEQLSELGYTKVMRYPGSWKEWSAKQSGSAAE